MADLYIRWNYTGTVDIGDRPISPCWPPNAVWTNASIWMSYPANHPDPAKRNMTAPNAVIGEEVLINVDVHSRAARFEFPLGELFRPVICQIWVSTGTNGVGPISAIPSAGGPTGMQGVVLGTIDVPDIYGVASVLWTPSAADGLTFDANGSAHVCIAANVYYRGSTGVAPLNQGQGLPQFVQGGPPVEIVYPCGDGPIDPLSTVPVGHFQGQRNIQVLSTSSNLRAPIDVSRRGGDGTSRTLILSERAKGVLTDAVVREHLLAHVVVGLRGGRPRRQRVRKISATDRKRFARVVDKRLLAVGVLPMEPRERAQLAGGGELVLADTDIRLRPATRRLADATLEGAKGVRGQTIEVVAKSKGAVPIVVDLHSAESDSPGTVRVFDLAERSARGRLIGGTTFITLSTGRRR